ncbi:MAG: PEGA domain-containing protein [Phycisphaerales bacterium]|jgi:hypothetical protein|nr:PEGA domain-containing protein [Phycisphaerales bacterium]
MRIVGAAILVMLMPLMGCVKRSILVTSEPPGALVWLNDREIGRTPVEVDFTYYGEYDIRLEHPDHEPIMTSRWAISPAWDWPLVDLAAEAMPVDLHSQQAWHFELVPLDNDTNTLLLRARELRTEATQ